MCLECGTQESLDRVEGVHDCIAEDWPPASPGFVTIESVKNDIGNGFAMDDYVMEKEA